MLVGYYENGAFASCGSLLHIPVMQGIGDGDDAVETSSATLKETEEGFQPVFFEPRLLVNLRLVDEVENLSPIMDIKVTCSAPCHASKSVLCTCSHCCTHAC